MKRRETECLGHILRIEKYAMLRIILKRQIEGKRPAKRRKYIWIRDLKE